MFIVAVNINLNSDISATWIQATLPISYGSIGICRAVQLTPFCLSCCMFILKMLKILDFVLVASNKESGTWTNEQMRIIVGMCLGNPLCRPHCCCDCGVHVDESTIYGLGFKKVKVNCHAIQPWISSSKYHWKHLKFPPS